MKKKNFKRKNKKTRSLFKKSKFKFNSNEIKLDRLNNLGKDMHYGMNYNIPSWVGNKMEPIA